MLQNLFYIASILASILTITVLAVFLILIIKVYKSVSATLEIIQTKAEEISQLITEVGDRGASLLNLATKEGQNAIKASTLLSVVMNSYFFLRTLLGHRK